MANYVVTIRTKDGSLSERDYTANDRAELFQKLAADGVTAVRVSEGAAGKKPRKAVKKAGAPSKGRGLVAAIAAILIVGVAAWFMWPEEKKVVEAKEEKKETKVAPAKPEKMRPVVKSEGQTEKPKRVTKKGTPIPDRVQKDEKGVYRWPGGMRWVDTNDLHIVKHQQKKRIFKHPSEEQIATLLTLDPSKMAPFLIGRRPKYGARFTADFKASLYEKIEFTDDDTEEDREIKQMVIDTKKDLKAAMERGEDVAAIMNDAQKELDVLASCYHELNAEIRKTIKDENVSDEDVEVLIEAANKMLEERGVRKIALPNMARRQAMLRIQRERRLLKAQQQ